jgi:putative ABC transport system permease protein
MTAFWPDVRLAVRMLARNRMFAAAAILALALGIGPNTAIFSIVYATLLAPLPYPQPEQLVMVWSKVQGGHNRSSAGDYLEWKERATAFQYLAAFTPQALNLGMADGPEKVRARLTTSEGYRLMGEQLLLGRDFTPEDEQPGRNQVVILSNRIWRQRFGANPDIVGHQIRMDSKPYTVIGVIPPGPSDRLPAALWTPLAFTSDQRTHDLHWLLVMGRLKPGVTLVQAQQQMDGIAADLARRFPQTNTGWGVSVEPLQNNFFGPDQQANLWLLLAAVSFVVLIACVNVANLLLARGAAREREMAVRSSLGASGVRLFRQILTESLVLAVAGGVAGALLSVWILQGVLALLPPGNLPAEADPRVSVPVLLFTLATAFVSGVLFGCLPAWQAGRADLIGALRQGGRGMTMASRRAVRQGLVLVEFALAVSLLAGAGLTIHSFWNRTRADLGIRTDRTLTFSLPVPQGRLSDPAQITSFYRDLLGRVKALPGVTHAAAATGLPFLGSSFGMFFSIAGQPAVNPSERPVASFVMITPEYLDTFGIRLVRGRALTGHDDAGGPRVALVNERFAERFLKGRDPLRERVLIDEPIPGANRVGPAVEWQIVGVYRNVSNGLQIGDPDRPEIWVPFWQCPWPQASMAVRTTLDPEGLRESVAAVVHAMDPELPLADAKTMDAIIGEWLAPDRFNIALYGGLAAVALLLAVLGLYGVMAFIVAQRTPEIGLRMALGAEQAQVRRQVLREGLMLATSGLLLGFAGAYVVGRLMQHALYGTSALDVRVLLPVGAVLLLSALVACYVPARRASRIDPIIALRQE